MFKHFLIAVLVLFCGSVISAFKYGQCPSLDPVTNFNMERIFGLWYAIQSTTTTTPCTRYNISINEENLGHYIFSEIKPSTPLWTNALYHEHRSNGDLYASNPYIPSEMVLQYPFSIKSRKFTVFMTDYNQYLAIFICRQLPFVYQWDAMILARTPKLNVNILDQFRTRLSTYNINPFALNIIKAKHCAPLGTKGPVLHVTSEIVKSVGVRLG